MSYHTERDIESIIQFLKKHEDQSLFLLGNLESYGPTVSEKPYSGNYQAICQGDELIAVFCLTRVGNLLITSTVVEPIFETLLDACLKEKLPIRGLLGEWDFCHKFWPYLKNQGIINEEEYSSKEPLYRLLLQPDQKVSFPNTSRLTEEHFNGWRRLNRDYLKEAGLPQGLTDEEVYELYLQEVANGEIWGHFVDNQLVSIADLNAKAFDLAQLGGVYTDPNHRRKGYSKRVIQKLIQDIAIEGASKLVIFTEEDNIGAQKLYESLGAEQVGYYSLNFGRPFQNSSIG